MIFYEVIFSVRTEKDIEVYTVHRYGCYGINTDQQQDPIRRHTSKRPY